MWTADSQRLILESFDAIRDSPSFTYHSAIPFSPSSSWLHQSYATSRGVKVVTGLPAEWGTCSRTVALGDVPLTLACWKDMIAVGLQSHNIVLLDAITGGQAAVLSGHTDEVRSLAFSSDGTLLVSGSHDETISLWDIQTGGMVKTFCGHTNSVRSVSISSDRSTIASGSRDQTIRLWNTWTGECCRVIEQDKFVTCVHFSPTDPRRLTSVSGGKVRQWDVGGNQIGPVYDGSHITFSSDGTRFVSCQGAVVTIRNSDSGTIIGQFLADGDHLECCCFSPDGKSVAAVVYRTIYVWDATGLDPHHVETFVGHTTDITSLAFSSFLISVSYDQSVKFWQTRPPPREPVASDRSSIPLASPPTNSITLRAEDGIAISSHSDGVVKIWDISTGLCRTSFQTPAEGPSQGDVQLIDNILVFVWWADEKVHIWDVEKGELLRTVDAPGWNVKGVRVSGDGSKVFCLDSSVIRAWSVSTGEAVGEVWFGGPIPENYLTVDDSRVWVRSHGSNPRGWDFGIPGSPPVPLSSVPPSRPHLEQNPRIKDMVTGKRVLQLSGRFANPVDAWWDGRYLVAGYDSGVVLILDLVHALPCRDL